MSSYTYKAILYKNPDVIGVAANNYAAEISDFETNHKSSATEISALIAGELVYETEGEYDWFDGTVINGTTRSWSDVKYIDDDVKYILLFTSENPI